jgi:uncharacterized phage protein (TIGR01671 family)
MNKNNMNRPIKFRVWDKRKNKGIHTQNMLYHAQLHRFWQDFVDYSGYELMQYTGLTDKNGKEIYEGDIIIDTQKQKYKIIFDENHARYDLKVCGENKLSQTSYFTQICEKKHIEVIGNIFENPELLK